MRITLTFPVNDRIGSTTFIHNGVTIEKAARADVLLTIARGLYRQHWLMYQEYTKDGEGSDILDRVVLINPKSIKP